MMQNQTVIDPAQQRKGRLMFIAMAIFFIVPVLVVVAMYKLNWRPSAGQSLGELVTPPRAIANTELLVDTAGVSADKFWLDKWTIVYLTDDCTQSCMNRLHDMRQIYVSMYKEMPRVKRLLITNSQHIAPILQQYPDMRVVNQPAAVIGLLAQQFNINQENAMQTGRLYFVDPLGHLMMSYPANTKAADIRRDLVKLLRSSWAG